MGSNQKNFSASVFLFLLVVLACGGPQGEPKQAVKAAVNIPGLARKSPQAIEAILGPAIEVINIPDGPDAPGEYRDYRVLENRYILTIRFLRGKPARFICDVTPPLKSGSSNDVAALFGLDVDGKAPNRMADDVTFWKGDFAGVSFQDVRVTGDSSEGFVEFRATPTY